MLRVKGDSSHTDHVPVILTPAGKRTLAPFGAGADVSDLGRDDVCQLRAEPIQPIRRHGYLMTSQERLTIAAGVR